MILRKSILTAAAIVAMTISLPQTTAASTNMNFEAIPGAYNHLITTLHRHSNGILWVGTATGLNRFDGYSVTPAQTLVPDSLSNIKDYISKICEDSKGRLWIKSQSLYCIYDPMTHTEVGDINKVLEEVGIPDGLITDIASDKDGSIWIAMADNGIYKIPGGTELAVKTEFKPNKDFNVSYIAFNKYGSAVCVDESGMLTWIDPHSLQVTDEVKPDKALSVNRKENYQLSVGKNNRYWIYSPLILELYDSNEGKWITDRIVERDKHGNTKHIYLNKKGELWIARDNHGFERVVDGENDIQFVPIDSPTDPTYKNTLTYFLDDDGGTTWIGTYKKGLFSTNESVKKFGIEELPDVNCMLAGSDNRVWVGTDSQGLWLWDTSTGEKHQVPDPSEGDTPAAITSLVKGPDNSLYVGAFAYGLRRVKDGRFESIKTGTALDNSYAWSLAPDGSGGLWIASMGGGLFHYNPSTGETKHYTDTNSGLRSNYLTMALKSKDGRTYIGHGVGIDYYDPADGLIHNIKDLSNNFNTEGWKLSQLFEDSRGLLWVGTSQGLKVIDRTHHKVTDVKTFQGKSTNYITGIIEDNEGSMWVSEGRILTNVKVSYADVTGDLKLSARHYDTEDGLMDSDFNQRSFAKLPSGEILLGGLYGANRFIPAEIKYNSMNPKVIFTDLYISDKLIHPGEKIKGKTIISEALHDGGEILLPHGTKDFTICFATDNYALPEKTIYQYKLEGYDDDWMTLPDGRHSVKYTNLSSGKYRLLVKGVNSDGFESDIPGELTIVVSPSFWITAWAFMIYAVVIALLVWGGITLIRRREQKRFDRRVEEEERKKQEEINQIKFDFFTNVSHDLRTPLTLIVSPLDEMIKDTHDERQHKRLSLLKDNATRLLALVNQLLDFRQNEATGLKLNPKEGDVVGFSKRVCDSFTSLSERKRINFSFYSDHNEIMMAFDEDKLEKIFMNLLSNAFKFTPSYGSISVSLEQVGGENPMLRIKVADTGKGIADKDKEFIFDSFYQANDIDDPQVQIGNGIGLSMVKEYVKLHQGTVRVTDNVEKGSVFIIDLPIVHSDFYENNEDKEDDQEEPGEQGSTINDLISSDVEHATTIDDLISSSNQLRVESEKATVETPDVEMTVETNVGKAAEDRVEFKDITEMQEENGEPGTEREIVRAGTEEETDIPDADDSDAGELPIALVVDDNPDMREMLRFELEKDFDVMTAADGNQALAKIKKRRPSIVLTDLMMPGMDGIELCRQMKSNSDTVSIPLIIVTAKHDLGVKIEGLTIGADDYITKPFNLDVLRLRMKRLIKLTGKGATRRLVDPEPESIKITPLDEKFIGKAMKYVSDNIDSPKLSVEDLSDHVGMSRVNLYKKIKQITGKTPVEFIRIIRLKRAAQLLRESQLNVSEIAYRTGFNNPKVFSKYFKEEFGILPSAYQNKKSKTAK